MTHIPGPMLVTTACDVHARDDDNPRFGHLRVVAVPSSSRRAGPKFAPARPAPEQHMTKRRASARSSAVSTTARSILVGPAQTQQPASSRDHLAGKSRETKRSRETRNRSVNKLKRFDDDVQDPRQNGSSQYCHQAVNGYVQQGFVGSNDPIDHRTHRSTRDHDD